MIGIAPAHTREIALVRCRWPNVGKRNAAPVPLQSPFDEISHRWINQSDGQMQATFIHGNDVVPRPFRDIHDVTREYGQFFAAIPFAGAIEVAGSRLAGTRS